MEGLFCEAWEALESLRLPWELTSAEKLDGPDFQDYYRIRFSDGPEITLEWKRGRQSFGTAVREAIVVHILGDEDTF